MASLNSSRFAAQPATALLGRYGTAVISVMLAFGTALSLRHYDLPSPFTSFSFAAIAVTFWYAGTGPGLLALLLSYLTRRHVPVPVHIDGSSAEPYLIIYGIFGVFVGWFSASRHRAERLLTEARDNLELRVAKRTSELAGANRELQTTQAELWSEKDRLKLLLELTNNVVSNLEIRDVLKAVIANVRQVMRSDFAGVGLPDSDGGRLRVYALAIAGDGTLSENESLPTEETVPSRVFRTGNIWVGKIQDLPEIQTGKNAFLAPGLKTACVLPLLSRKRVLGILILGRREDDRYIKEDIDFLTQVSNQIAIAIENALSFRQISELTDKLALEKLYLEDEIRSDADFEEMVGKSQALHRVLRLVETVAPTDSTVLISGETGTGKELIARAIHNLSPRASKTFVKLNCAALPAGLLESELFGHEKGAFTGAVAQRIGRLELADHGTIFLDEVGEIPLELQPKLLRVLQEREIERLGGTRTIRTDVRLIAATNRDLAAMVQEQTFRSDLYFRLNVFPVELPPLRERPEDIPLLVRHFAEEISRRMNKTIEAISSETMQALCQYHWPGNIRELQNVIERAVILSSGPSLKVPVTELQPRTAPVPARDDESAGSTRRTPVRSILAEVDRNQIIRALKETDGRIGGPNGAANRLGLKRTTFITRMKKLGIDARTVSEHDGTSTDTSDGPTP